MNRNHLVTFTRQSTSQDDAGQQVETWTEIGQEWASIRPISGREYFNASGERAEITHELTVPKRLAIAPRDRVEYGSRVFNIRAVMNVDERNRYLKLMCTEHVV